MGIGCVVVDRFTCQIPENPLQAPSRNRLTLFYTLMCKSGNVALHPSSHNLPMNISAPDWRWGNMCSILSLVDNKGLDCI